MGQKEKDQDLKIMRQKVFNWLEQLFGDETIPQFEVNPRTIKALYQLSLINGHNDKIVQLMVDDARQKTDEYTADTTRLEHVMSKLDMGGSSFSQAGLSSVRTLALLGKLLCVKDSSDTCYILSMKDLQKEMYAVTEQLEKENKDLHLLARKSHSALMKRTSLQKSYESVQKKAIGDQAMNNERKEETVFMKSKSKSYAKDIAKIEAKLAQSGADKSIFHENLVEKEKSLRDLRTKLEPLKQELHAYSSLPPDLIEAKIKIEQLKRELAEVAKQMSACVDPGRT